ncbi:lethal giant larvae like, C-terminal-domain-containing protein [Apodospora peruviana]|uniref:Lethal giant larvae like, C-terminal-domain-containing protein n=1 Tax=Apodospora peruviana TaxID=516989 RepID=A0AAE0IBE6_9PEZI|nr:lethal giant larvae like, C-terminal-domain-containing protein [Apodospora peruviana]
MASFLRGKQAGMQNDLSAGILAAQFAPDEQSRYGINSQISCLAYEPVQSLLAVGTNESKFGPGKIYVFGQSRVHKFFSTSARPTSFRQLHFVANRLVSLDSHNEIAIWDLDTVTKLGKYVYPGTVCVATDPMLDWALVGQQNGDVFAYDLDRERPSPFRIPNFWAGRDRDSRDPRAGAALVGMQLHPRDIGRLLIAYSHGAVIYSFKQNLPVKFFEYTLPPGAPGGNGEGVGAARRPRLTHALWHPTGTFVLTAHEDGSLVFWDAKDGRLVAARSIYDTRINEPTSKTGQSTPVAPFTKVVWCCKENPDDTALLIAGGQALDDPQAGLTFIELGQTPIYATSSWDILAAHFEGRRRLSLQIPPGVHVVDFCLIPRFSPHFAGAQDPIAVLATLSSGELITLSFPSGFPITPTNMLHPSLSFVQPFVTRVAVSTLDRGRWLGMTEKRNQGALILKGGAEAPKRRKRYEGRNIIQVAHADSTIRIWDLGHGDEIENPTQLQVDIARAVDRYEDVEVTAMDMAETTGEFAAGTIAGEVVVYRWGGNKFFGRDEVKPLDSNPGGLTDISSRAEPSLKEGLQPFVLYEMMQGPVSVVSVSDVGFVAAGSEGGFLSIVDLRGPAVIYQGATSEFTKQEKKGFLKSHSSSSSHSSGKEWPIVIEFGVMTLEGDSYSSIACFVGTNLGRVATFKLLPSGQGYTVKLAGVSSLDGKVIAICPTNVDTGHTAAATGPVVAGLREGKQVNGTLVAVSETEVRIFKPATAKGASKSFDGGICHAAAVAELDSYGFALVALFNDRTTRCYSLPGLKEIGRSPLRLLDPARTAAGIVAKTGDVVGWIGPSELVVFPVWGSGKALEKSLDTLVNPDLATPPRPTISNLQWISGTQYVSPTDLDLLIGGPDRPASKRMLAATAAEQQQARAGGASARAGGTTADGQEGWGEYLTRQLNERTERLNIMGDSMDNLQQSSANWADDVGKYMNKQKRNVLLGGIKKSLF